MMPKSTSSNLFRGWNHTRIESGCKLFGKPSCSTYRSRSRLCVLVDSIKTHRDLTAGVRMVLVRAFPFLALVVLAYNVLLVFGGASPGAVAGEVRLPSGALWSITTADVLVIVAFALLAVEVVSVGSR